MKPPDYLVPKNRKSAIHFMVKSTVTTPLFGPTEVMSVACGQPYRIGHTTTSAHLVTCSVCWPIANPTKSPYES